MFVLILLCKLKHIMIKHPCSKSIMADYVIDLVHRQRQKKLNVLPVWHATSSWCDFRRENVFSIDPESISLSHSPRWRVSEQSVNQSERQQSAIQSVSQLSLYYGVFVSNGRYCNLPSCQHPRCNSNLNLQHSQQASDVVFTNTKMSEKENKHMCHTVL